METIKAFYFATEDRKLRYGDEREIVVGETHSVDGEIKVCRNGLHASEKLLDALMHAPGCILYLVELSGHTDSSSHDKLAARNRKYLAEFNVTEVLKEFARKQALINIEKIKPYCSEEKYNLIVKFLETSYDDAHARARARSAAAAVAYAVVCVASRAAADAAYYATAARATASRARAASRAAARARHSSRSLKTLEQVEDEQNEMLTEMIRDATGWDI